jgi:hypothetical protein
MRLDRITWKDVFSPVRPDDTSPSPKLNPPAPVPVSSPTKPTAQEMPKTSFVTPPAPPPTPMRPIQQVPVNDPSTLINSDSLFLIGDTHDVCQDYVSNKNSGGKSYVVLADGCSGSRDSDVGARILVKTHELYIPDVNVMDFHEYAQKADGLYTHIIEETAANAHALELDPMSLDATVMSIVSNKNGDFMVTSYGDGVVALGRRDGAIEVYSVSYKEGFPNYLSYRLNQNRMDRFKAKTGNYKEITLDIMEPGKPTQTSKYKSSVMLDIYLGSQEKYLWVAVMSDGVQSFTERIVTDTVRTNEIVPLRDVLEELLAFKNFQGTFVRRRVNRFMEVCETKKWSHSDDFSIGVVYLGDKNINGMG